MAQNATGIKNSWSLIAFAKEFGPKMQVGQFANHETGETFKSTIFTKGDTRTFVAFSRNLGEMTPREIAANKNDLQVVLCETSDGSEMYSLCKKGDPDKAWQDVDLGL